MKIYPFMYGIFGPLMSGIHHTLKKNVIYVRNFHETQPQKMMTNDVCSHFSPSILGFITPIYVQNEGLLPFLA